MSSRDLEIKFPNVGNRKQDGEFYGKLIDKGETGSPFSGLMMSDVFIYAMALGFNEGQKTSFLVGEKAANMPASAFDNDKRWLMRVIAVKDTGDLKTILDNKKVVQIAEQYANTGIEKLRELDKNSSEDGELYEDHLRAHYDSIE